jgi:hypothetical protein
MATKPAQPLRSADDTRWYPWLGCWQQDSTGAGRADGTTTCMVPVPGSSVIEAVKLAGGKVLSRDRLDASGRSLPVVEDGCRGSRAASWSPNRHQVYLTSAYTCAGGLDGALTTLMAIAQNGEWVEIENVRSGGGSMDRVERWHDVGIDGAVPEDIASAIARRRLPIATARAAASAPLSATDVIDALHTLDPGVVRDWLVASGQRFSLDSAQTAELVEANVPPGVLQAMMGADARTRQGFSADATRGAALESGGYYGTEMTGGYDVVGSPTVYGYPAAVAPYGDYAPYPAYGYGYPYGYSAALAPYWLASPLVVVHRGERAHPTPPRRGPVGIPRVEPRRPH